MGQCHGKNTADGSRKPRLSKTPTHPYNGEAAATSTPRHEDSDATTPARESSPSWPSPFGSPLPAGTSPSPASSSPKRFFRRPFPPPSPAKHIRAALAKRQAKQKEESATDAAAKAPPLDKKFGFGKHFACKYELGKEVGRGHFGNTCLAKVKKGELKGQTVAVKVIAKSKMTTPISIEDVRREVKILKALSGHKNLVKFHDACEDANNVYIVMELCEGGELLDRILSRGGRYTEEDAKAIVSQILSVVSFCHLQGVVHRDLKPENFLFASKDENSHIKLIDFGLSDFTRPDERLNDIVGSAYYVAPEVLRRSYSTEADMWSIGVITYILLCGSRPFWAQTESGIFRSVLRADPNFDNAPWPSVSAEAKDFVERLLNKDYRKRMTAAQALTHPWLRNEQRPVPLDILVYRLMKAYLRATPLRQDALKALAKALPEEELFYLKLQFELLQPNKDGFISLENFRMALMQNATEALELSRMPEILNSLEALSYRKIDLSEFCAGAISPNQFEAMDRWEQIANAAFEHFEREGNRVPSVGEIAQEFNLPRTAAETYLQKWIRPEDGKLCRRGFTRYLHGLRSAAR